MSIESLKISKHLFLEFYQFLFLITLKMTSNLFNKFYEIISKIPKGKVATYGQIAALAGHPRSARMVGWALRALHHESPLPWHRVINSKGRISLPENSEGLLQKFLLEAEGVVFDQQGQVNLEQYQWNGRA